MRLHTSVVLSFALAACTQIADFDRSQIPGAGGADDASVGRDGSLPPPRDGGGDGDGGLDASAPCDLETHAGCGANELCCADARGDVACVTARPGQCTACGEAGACDAASAGRCENRTCVCVPGSGEACDPNSDAPSCVGDVCAACENDIDCEGNVGGEVCLDGTCVGCKPGVNPCPRSAPICRETACVPCSSSPNDCPGGLTCVAGECVGCDPTGDVGCSAPKPQCDPDGKSCVQCLADADCSARTPICDGENSCAPCASDAQCAGKASGAICVTDFTPGENNESGRCAVCDPADDGGCTGANKRCLQEGTKFSCVQCLADADCGGATPLCNVSTNVCVPCTDPAVSVNVDRRCSNVSAGAVCVRGGALAGQCGECNPGDDSGCSGTTPICNPANAQCAKCTDVAGSDSECAARNASLPACQPSGACGECSATNKARCAGGEPACDTSVGQCVPCVTSSDCTNVAQPVCSATQECVACTALPTGDRDAACASKSASSPYCVEQRTLAGQCGVCDVATEAGCTTTAKPYCVASASSVECQECDPANESATCPGTGPSPRECVNTGSAQSPSFTCERCDPADASTCAVDRTCSPSSFTCVK